MDKINLPPFYIGESIVCVNTSPNREGIPCVLKKNEPYQVEQTKYYAAINAWAVLLVGNRCPFNTEGFYLASRFKSQKEKLMPLISFSDIKQKEFEKISAPEILISN